MTARKDGHLNKRKENNMNCNVTISEDVAEVLKAADIKENILILNGQLSRELYQKVNKTLELIGGTWNRKFKGHVFSSNPTEIIANALGTGKIENKKKKFQFFETPVEVAEKLVSYSCTISEENILEPSAGTGRIADVIARRLEHPSHVHFCEVQTEFCDILSEKGYTKVGDDFLKFFPEHKYFTIIMNPPFTNGMDIDHVMHAYNNCLAPGGELIAIMSPAFQFREHKKFSQFREFIEYTGAYVEELPDGAFKESGTGTKTVLVKIDK